MNDVVYRIPGLAVVTLSPDVPGSVQEAVSFQLGHFRQETMVDGDGDLPLIRVLPFKTQTAPAQVHLHETRGDLNRVLEARQAGHATERTERGFDVYTNTTEPLIVLLLQALLLPRGRTFIHAAAWVDKSGRATLLPGPGGVGKTALLSAAVLRHGLRLLGDDLILAGSPDLEAFPRAFVLKDYHRDIFPEAWKQQAARSGGWRTAARPVVQFVRRNAPFHGLAKSITQRAGKLDQTSAMLQRHAVPPDFFTVPVADLFGADKVAQEGRLDRVIWLERRDAADFELKPADPAALATRAFSILMHEWADHARWLGRLGAMQILDQGYFYRRTEELLQATLADRPCWVAGIPARASPSELEQWFNQELGFNHD